MSDEKIVLTYCPNNPKNLGSDIYERLGEDPRFSLRSPYCRKLCVTCARTFYTWVGESRENGLVFGRTEEEFIAAIEAATGADMTGYKMPAGQIRESGPE